ncbi:MAG: virulence protein [Dethiobacter sp.]|nr:virulence protein [Dethiobacter sp.]MBS3898841.1 virulence protein [Dethiobacter sp.]
MKITYNVTGGQRKSLIGAISQELNAPTKYLGAPTFSYEVGGYHIDKNGVVTGPDNLDLEAGLHALHGFEAKEREYDNPDTYESALGGMVAKPSIEELNELWAESEMRRMKLEDANVPDYSNRGQYGGDDISAFDEPQIAKGEEVDPDDHCDTLTIEMPLAGFTDAALENLERLIASKAALIKKAIGAEALPIERTETTLRFPWFKFGIDGATVAAYSRFIGALYAAAKIQKRVTGREKPAENEKYAFRVFLLRLGFVGREYVDARKILLKNLSGSSAFKSGARSKTEVDSDA